MPTPAVHPTRKLLDGVGHCRKSNTMASDFFEKRKIGSGIEKGGPDGAAPFRKTCPRAGLGRAEVHRFRAAAVGFDVEFDNLAVSQRVQAGCLHGSDVNEDVLFATFRRDEAEAFGGVEEFNGAFGHFFVVLF